jgi:hypothetical protein
VTNPSSAASEIATWSSAAVAPIGVWIAFLVYRLNADRYYLDTLDKRWTALREVFEAASERQREAATIDYHQLADMPAQGRFWLAKDRADPLFDARVKAAMQRLDDALRDFSILRAELLESREYGDRVVDAGKRHSATVSEILAASEALSRAAKPFVTLGSRGLSFRQKTWRRLSRIRLRRRTRRAT